MESYIEQTLVFIGSAIVLVPIFKYLGFGSVLGYLIAGIIVGPHGLQFINDPDAVLRFAELGVIFLLFMIGIEIQPFKLWSMRKHLLGLGGLQILITSTLFMFIGKWFGMTTVCAFVIGFSMSLSSTAFAMQTLKEKNEFNTEFGRASFSVLLMQDLVAIPALAIIPVLVSSGDFHIQSSLRLYEFAGILLTLILISRYLMRPIFRGIAAIHSREIFTAIILFIVLGVAFLMQKIGLSAALGTFIAGVLLAESEYRHEIEANLEPFKSLLMGLFFIAVGMSVSLHVISEHPFLIPLLGVGYLIMKMAVIYLVGRLFKLDHENSKRMGLYIAQGGEFAFVIFGMIVSFKLATSEVIDTLSAVITLSMALSPLLSKLNDFLSKKLQKIIESKAYDVISNETPQVIIAGVGRFGQIFGRLLRAQNIPFVAIDHDSNQIELLRKFGNKAYYGDASRLDLLEAAGASNAKYFILAVDDVETSKQIAKTVREHFPKLTIFARARNRGHAFDLMNEGITHIKRETFDSSVYFVRDLLVDMGFPLNAAKSIMKRFRNHDELMMLEQYKVHHDDKMFVSVSKQGTAQLARVLSNEATQTYVDAKAANSDD